jgi:hypothetical protein
VLPADLDGGDEVAKACDIPKLALMASIGIDHFVMAITSGVDHFVMAITSGVRNKAYQKDAHHSATTEECSHDDDEWQPVLRGRRGAIYPGSYRRD